MKTYEEKSTCSSSWSSDQGDQENAHTETAEGEGGAAGEGAGEKVARCKREGAYKSPPFKGGEVFGQLTVIKFNRYAGSAQMWDCRCECGKMTLVMRRHLISGGTRSCGCLRQCKPFQGGEVFGRFTVISFSHIAKRVHYYKCRCSCGTIKTVQRSGLLSGNIRSCGCLVRDNNEQRTKHGCARNNKVTKEYTCWLGMISRCENPNYIDYNLYGGRGIKICKRWRDSFEAFLQDMGCKPSPKHSIDRIDTNGNYEPGNCRWSNLKEQGRNKRNNVIFTHDGYTATQSEWSERTGISVATIRQRLLAGWSIADALTKPVRKLRRSC